MKDGTLCLCSSMNLFLIGIIECRDERAGHEESKLIALPPEKEKRAALLLLSPASSASSAARAILRPPSTHTLPFQPTFSSSPLAPLERKSFLSLPPLTLRMSLHSNSRFATAVCGIMHVCYTLSLSDSSWCKAHPHFILLGACADCTPSMGFQDRPHHRSSCRSSFDGQAILRITTFYDPL